MSLREIETERSLRFRFDSHTYLRERERVNDDDDFVVDLCNYDVCGCVEYYDVGVRE